MTSAAEVGLPEVDIPMPTIVIGPTARVDKEVIGWSALGHLTWSSRLLSVVCVSHVWSPRIEKPNKIGPKLLLVNSRKYVS